MKKFFLLFISCLLVSCSSPTPTPTSTPTENPVCNSDSISDYISWYIDDYGPRMYEQLELALHGLAPMNEQAKKIQTFKSEFMEIKVPYCMEAFSSYLLDSLDNFANGFSAFASEGNTEEVTKMIGDGATAFKAAMQELERMRACLPNCTPQE